MNDSDIVSIVVVAFCLIFGGLVIFKKGFIEKIRTTLYPYPLSSRPGDKMFPDKNDTYGWVVYISLSIVLLLFLSQIFLMIKNPSFTFSIWVGMIMFFFMLVSGVAQGFSDSEQKSKKPNQSLKDGTREKSRAP